MFKQHFNTICKCTLPHICQCVYVRTSLQIFFICKFATTVKGEVQVFLNLDLISGIKYVHLLTDNSLVKVGVLRKIFRFLEIHITE